MRGEPTVDLFAEGIQAARQPVADRGGRAAPGPRGRHLIGSLLEVRRDRLSFVLQSARQYGDVVAFQMGPRRLFLLRHPDHFRQVLSDRPGRYRKGVGLTEARPLLGDGLLTSEGELAAAQRRRSQCAFHGERIQRLATEMVGTTETMLQRWLAVASEGGSLDAAHEMVLLTLTIFGDTLLHTDLRAEVEGVAADLTVLTRWAMQRMTALVPIPVSLPTPANLRARRALGRLDRLAARLLERRLPGGDDLLSLLGLSGAGSSVDPRRFRDELLTFLLAGHETTAAALTWTWHLLAHHPEVDRRLYEELVQVLQGRPPTAADLPALTYTRAVVEEAVRLYPPVWIIPRRAVEDDDIGGYRVPAGADVLLSIYSLHRHPEFWDHPESFDPERFIPPAAARQAAGAYLPFGVGPRSCLGGRFGMMEVILVVAAVAQRVRLEPVPGYDVEPEASLTLRPRRAVPMRLRRRP